MNQVDDKELLMKAIDNYSIYTSIQQQLLKLLINIAIDDVVIATITDLRNLTGISRPSLYRSLERLSKDGLIEINQDTGVKLTSLKLKRNKLSVILEHFIKKDNLLRK